MTELPVPRLTDIILAADELNCPLGAKIIALRIRTVDGAQRFEVLYSFGEQSDAARGMRLLVTGTNGPSAKDGFAVGVYLENGEEIPKEGTVNFDRLGEVHKVEALMPVVEYLQGHSELQGEECAGIKEGG